MKIEDTYTGREEASLLACEAAIRRVGEGDFELGISRLRRWLENQEERRRKGEQAWTSSSRRFKNLSKL